MYLYVVHVSVGVHVLVQSCTVIGGSFQDSVLSFYGMASRDRPQVRLTAEPAHQLDFSYLNWKGLRGSC